MLRTFSKPVDPFQKAAFNDWGRQPHSRHYMWFISYYNKICALLYIAKPQIIYNTRIVHIIYEAALRISTAGQAKAPLMPGREVLRAVTFQIYIRPVWWKSVLSPVRKILPRQSWALCRWAYWYKGVLAVVSNGDKHAIILLDLMTEAPSVMRYYTDIMYESF